MLYFYNTLISSSKITSHPNLMGFYFSHAYYHKSRTHAFLPRYASLKDEAYETNNNISFSPKVIKAPNWNKALAWSISINLIDCFLSVRPLVVFNSQTKKNMTYNNGYSNGKSDFQKSVRSWVIKNFTPYEFVSILAIEYLNWHTIGPGFSFPSDIPLGLTFNHIAINSRFRPYVYFAYVTFDRLGGFSKILPFSIESTNSYNKARDILRSQDGLIFISRPGSGKTYLTASIIRFLIADGKAIQVAYLCTKTIVLQNLPVFLRFGFRLGVNLFTDGYSFIHREKKDDFIPLLGDMPKNRPTCLILDESQFVQNCMARSVQRLADFIFNPQNSISQVIIISSSPFDGCVTNFSVLLFVLRNKGIYVTFSNVFRNWRFNLIEEGLSFEEKMMKFDQFKPYAKLIKPFICEHHVEFKHKAVIEVISHSMNKEDRIISQQLYKILTAKLKPGQQKPRKAGLFSKLYFHLERSKTQAFSDQVIDLVSKGYNVLLVVTLKSIIDVVVDKLMKFDKSISYVILTGQSTTATRLAAIEEFHENKVQVILSTKILDTGLNIAPIVPKRRPVSIITSISWSNIRLIQLIGRVVRLNNVSDPLIRVIYTDKSWMQKNIRLKFTYREILQQTIYAPIKLAEEIYPKSTKAFIPLLNAISVQLSEIEK